jgi:uncharacterized membrane protein
MVETSLSMTLERGDVDRGLAARPGTAGGPAEEKSREIDRLVFFSDAVFAFAMTLLVQRILVPSGPDFTHQVLAQWPKYLSYLLSFLVVALYWLRHHRIFRHITRWDEGLIRLNLLLLFFIAFMPFSSAMIGQRGGYRISIVFYATTLGFAGLANLLIWLYATHDHRLVAADLDPGLIRRQALRTAVPPLVFFLSIPLSFVSTDAAYYSWLLIPAALLALRATAGTSRGDSAAGGPQAPRKAA